MIPAAGPGHWNDPDEVLYCTVLSHQLDVLHVGAVSFLMENQVTLV